MPIRAFVFDAYGTLFDVHAAIARHRAAAGPDADRFSEVWRTKQLEYAWMLSAAGHYIDFWTLTERALDYAFARFPAVDRALRPSLLECYFKLDAFPDARAALAALAGEGPARPRSCRTAIRACCLARSRQPAWRRISTRFSPWKPSAVYKPRPEVYALVTDAFGIAPADVAFVSSNRWDVMGATAFGFRCVWVNRANMPDEYPEFAPVKVVRDLSALATLPL